MSVHTDAKNATRKNVIFSVIFYPTNEIGAFAHVSGAAEVTVKHNLGALKHKTVLPSTRVVSHYRVTLQYPVSAVRVLL